MIGAAGGTATTCAVLEDGTVSCWGENGYGQLGDGTTLSRSTPAPVRVNTNAAVKVAWPQ